VDISIKAVTTVNEFAHGGVDLAVVDVVTEAAVELVFELKNEKALWKVKVADEVLEACVEVSERLVVTLAEELEVGVSTRLAMAIAVPLLELVEAIRGVFEHEIRATAVVVAVARDAEEEALEDGAGGAREDVVHLGLFVDVRQFHVELELHLDEPWGEGGLVVELRRIRDADWRRRGCAASDLRRRERVVLEGLLERLVVRWI